MKKIEYGKLIALMDSAGYDVHMIGQDRYFIDRDDRIGIQINASRPITEDERDETLAFRADNDGGER